MENEAGKATGTDMNPNVGGENGLLIAFPLTTIYLLFSSEAYMHIFLLLSQNKIKFIKEASL